MAWIVMLFGAFMALLGAVGVISPGRLVSLVRRFQSPSGIWIAAALRLALGAALFLAAPESRSPQAIEGLGVFVFVAGLITPFFGLEGFRSLLDWWEARGPVLHRVWAAFALLFGLFLIGVVN